MCFVTVLKKDIQGVVFCSEFMFILLTTNNKQIFLCQTDQGTIDQSRPSRCNRGDKD